jgi:integrase
MASVGIRKRVSARTGRVTYQVWWLLDDGSQGAETVATPAEARELQAEKQLEIARGAWQGRRRGRLTFDRWAEEWWVVWSTDPDRSPTTLAATENRLRRHVRPWFGQQPLEAIRPTLIRQWQNQLASQLGHESLMACRSILFRILQLAEDEGAIAANPVRKVPAPKRRVDPDRVFADATRRALTPEEAGQLLARFPLFWWDHVLCLLGTGLRFGEFAGLRLRRVHLDRAIPVLQVVDTRYQAGRFGSGFKPRPKSDAGLREIPWPRWWWRRLAASCRLRPTRTRWSLPVPAAGTACPLAHGRYCRAMAFVVSTSTPFIAPEVTLSICNFADPTIFGTVFRPGSRMKASRPG